jgi:hypothetical protein
MRLSTYVYPTGMLKCLLFVRFGVHRAWPSGVMRPQGPGTGMGHWSRLVRRGNRRARARNAGIDAGCPGLPGVGCDMWTCAGLLVPGRRSKEVTGSWYLVFTHKILSPETKESAGPISSASPAGSVSQLGANADSLLCLRRVLLPILLDLGLASALFILGDVGENRGNVAAAAEPGLLAAGLTDSTHAHGVGIGVDVEIGIDVGVGMSWSSEEI